MTAHTTLALREWVCADHHATYTRAATLGRCPHMNHGMPCKAPVWPVEATRGRGRIHGPSAEREAQNANKRPTTERTA